MLPRTGRDAGVGWGRGRKQHGKKGGGRGAWEMKRVAGEVEGGRCGCLVQSVRADYSTFFASATYLHL